MQVALDGAEQKFLDCSDCDAEKPAGSGDSGASASKNPLTDLERRVNELHRSPLFTVVDREGHPIMAVRPGALLVYDGSGHEVATMRAAADEGSITAAARDIGLTATLRSSGSEAGVELRERDTLRLRLTGKVGGTYALAVPAPGASGALAGIGASKAGSGALIVATTAGATRASLIVSDGKGMAGIYNGQGVAVLSLTEGALHGGLLAIGNLKSEPAVKMGVNGDRYGVVLTGPRAGMPLVTGSGLPGSYILGCASGPACEP